MEIQGNLQHYQDLKVDLFNVSELVTKRDGSNNGIWYHEGHLNPKEEILLGFSPTNYHSFIVCGEKEFHSRFSFNKCKTVRSRRKSIRAGVFLRVRGIKRSDLEEFQIYLQTIHGLRTPSCHIGTLQALEKGLGIRIPNCKQYKLTPYELMYYSLKNGLVDRNGNKLEVSMYTTRDKTLRHIFEEVIQFQKHFRIFYVASDLVYYLFFNLFRKKSLVKDTLSHLMLQEKTHG